MKNASEFNDKSIIEMYHKIVVDMYYDTQEVECNDNVITTLTHQ